MCKKTPIAVLLLLTLLSSCGNPPRKAGAVREERHTPELLAAVPSDALAVICYDHCADGMRLYDSTSVLAQLNLSAFKNARMALSLCYNGSLVPVLALDCGRTVGITLTDSLLMTPSKSVTAIIGMKERKPE